VGSIKMAHFAEIDNNNIVLRVTVVPDEESHRGQEYMNQDLGLEGTWLQTSYNTFEGTHKLGGTPFRGNFAGGGYIYDPVLDAFYLPQPYPSWTLDTEKFKWVAPTPRPTPGYYVWNEESLSWKLPKEKE
jgi:hypothetical protein